MVENSEMKEMEAEIEEVTGRLKATQQGHSPRARYEKSGFLTLTQLSFSHSWLYIGNGSVAQKSFLIQPFCLCT